jgi:hypothetical protein
MKKSLSVSVILFFVLALNAQVTGNSNNMSDSSGHHFVHHTRFHDGKDSLHRQLGDNRGAMNGIGERHHRYQFRPIGKNRSGWAHSLIRYTPEQREQIKAINEDYSKKWQNLYNQDNITLHEYKSQLLALQKDKKSKMVDLLTPEQKNEIEKWKKHAEEKMQVRSAAYLESMKIHLNLSDDQTAKIKLQQESFHAQQIAIHHNDNLLSFQKKEQMKTLMAKRDDAMKSVLSQEQFSQFEKMQRQGFVERFERNNMN